MNLACFGERNISPSKLYIEVRINQSEMTFDILSVVTYVAPHQIRLVGCCVAHVRVANFRNHAGSSPSFLLSLSSWLGLSISSWFFFGFSATFSFFLPVSELSSSELTAILGWLLLILIKTQCIVRDVRRCAKDTVGAIYIQTTRTRGRTTTHGKATNPRNQKPKFKATVVCLHPPLNPTGRGLALADTFCGEGRPKAMFIGQQLVAKRQIPDWSIPYRLKYSMKYFAILKITSCLATMPKEHQKSLSDTKLGEIGMLFEKKLHTNK